ncbi:MAG TPA: hypothetical protein VNX68_06130, partial [Nitrosopumilaceae archaeon]|nr:hypothetical protein [Nitrosopumilaceae archaeon]
AHAEVAAFTPAQGYDVVFFNNAMPVGAKLSLNKHDDQLVNATADEQKQQEKNTDPEVSVIILSPSYADNLKMVLGSGASTGVINAPSVTPSIPSVTPPNISPVTNTSAAMNDGNESAIISQKLNNTNSTLPQTGQQTLTATNINQTTTSGTHKSANINENLAITTK